MTDKSLTVFDGASIADKVRERIQTTIAELIPEEHWKELVQKEITRFVKGGEKDRYGNAMNSVVQNLVQKELEALLVPMVKTALGSPEWAGFWDNNKHQIGPELAKLIEQQGPKMLTAFLTNAFQSVISNMTIPSYPR